MTTHQAAHVAVLERVWEALRPYIQPSDVSHARAMFDREAAALTATPQRAPGVDELIAATAELRQRQRDYLSGPKGERSEEKGRLVGVAAERVDRALAALAAPVSAVGVDGESPDVVADLLDDRADDANGDPLLTLAARVIRQLASSVPQGAITGWRMVDGHRVFDMKAAAPGVPDQQFVRYDDFKAALASGPSGVDRG